MVKAGEVSAEQSTRAQFESFARANGDRLLHAAFALCGNWQDGEELVQHALISVARHWNRIGDNPTGYAYRCLTRRRIDRWRERRRHHEVPVEPYTLAETLGHCARQSGTDAVDAQLTATALLQHLPPRQRSIVVLRYLMDLSEAEVAAILGISPGSVKSGASRGLARLRKTFPVESWERP